MIPVPREGNHFPSAIRRTRSAGRIRRIARNHQQACASAVIQERHRRDVLIESIESWLDPRVAGGAERITIRKADVIRELTGCTFRQIKKITQSVAVEI